MSHRSLYNNFEWFSGYSCHFGIVRVDCASGDLTRYVKRSAQFYSNYIIEARVASAAAHDDHNDHDDEEADDDVEDEDEQHEVEQVEEDEVTSHRWSAPLRKAAATKRQREEQ